MSSKANRIPVYFPLAPDSAHPANAPHRTSPAFASLLVRTSWATYLYKDEPKKGIVLLSHTSWASVKEHFRKTTTSVMPKLLPPRTPEALMLSYPPKNYESDGNRKQKQLWLTASRF